MFNFDLDLHRVNVNQHTKYTGKCHLVQILSSAHTHAHVIIVTWYLREGVGSGAWEVDDWRRSRSSTGHCGHCTAGSLRSATEAPTVSAGTNASLQTCTHVKSSISPGAPNGTASFAIHYQLLWRFAPSAATGLVWLPGGPDLLLKVKIIVKVHSRKKIMFFVQVHWHIFSVSLTATY